MVRNVPTSICFSHCLSTRNMQKPPHHFSLELHFTQEYNSNVIQHSMPQDSHYFQPTTFQSITIASISLSHASRSSRWRRNWILFNFPALSSRLLNQQQATHNSSFFPQELNSRMNFFALPRRFVSLTNHWNEEKTVWDNKTREFFF